MTSPQVKQSLNDITSNYNGQHVNRLLNYVASLYQLSLRKQNLNNKTEIARHHLCAYVVVEKYQQQFDLPQPDIQKIPLPPKAAEKLLENFREFINDVSAASTPNTTPKKTKMSESPKKRQSDSPLKKLVKESDQPVEKKLKSNLNDKDSPFNPRKGMKVTTVGGKVYKYDTKNVTIPDFIAFCNTFYIPGQVTAKMVPTFLIHKHKFTKKTDWSLACGMVYAAYIRINHKLLSEQVGTKSKFLDLLLQYQKGGLSKWSLQSWCTLVGEWIKDEPWILDLEKQYMYGSETTQELKLINERNARIGKGWDLIETFGGMLHGENLFQSESQNEYFNTWSQTVLHSL